jgi:hypothetical protein
MSQVGHIVAAQYERAIGHVHCSLRIFGPNPYACISSVNSKICKHRRLEFVSTAGSTTSGRLMIPFKAKAASLKKWSAVPCRLAAKPHQYEY